MTRNEPEQSMPAGGTSTDDQNTGKQGGGGAASGKMVKIPDLEKIKADWENLGKKVRDLNEKINQNVLRNIEKLENLHYQNIKNADAIKQKIEQDWEAFEIEVKNGMENLKKLGQQNTEKALKDLNARKEEMQARMKTWEKNYQEWSAKILIFFFPR
ncbi:MAG: hypothetical protein Q6365_001575 [Candidatus Sigynarchaeota archaeon]